MSQEHGQSGPGTPTNPSTSHPLAGRYVLIDQIGHGGMGSVWRAWDLRTQRWVAAKVLGQHDGSMLLRFVREQSVRIQHPHVVAPSGWAAEDNLVVFTMDLVHGGSVQTLLGDHGSLPESYVRVLLDQTLQALDAVHSAGVVHRDVKPANLLLEPTGTARPHVRLGDFGIASLVDDVRLTRFPGAIGTDGYMAPEQSYGAPPDPRQDLYAAGVVAIQMLTGKQPRGHTREEALTAPAGPLKALLDAMVSVDVERRPPSAAAALEYLRHLGVPPGAVWQSLAEPPEVFDQLGDAEIPSVPSGPQTPPDSRYVGAVIGSPGGPASGGTPSGPGGGPLSGPGPSGSGPHSGVPAATPGPDSGPQPGSQPGSQPSPAAYANLLTAQPAGDAALRGGSYVPAMACFALALVLSVIALVLLLR